MDTGLTASGCIWIDTQPIRGVALRPPGFIYTYFTHKVNGYGWPGSIDPDPLCNADEELFLIEQ